MKASGFPRKGMPMCEKEQEKLKSERVQNPQSRLKSERVQWMTLEVPSLDVAIAIYGPAPDNGATETI
jgi:hypothetical protein